MGNDEQYLFSMAPNGTLIPPQFVSLLEFDFRNYSTMIERTAHIGFYVVETEVF